MQGIIAGLFEYSPYAFVKSYKKNTLKGFL